VKAALVLVFLENMVQFGFEFTHRNISRFGLTLVASPQGREDPRLLNLP